MNEDRLKELLREAPIADWREAEQRGLRVVKEAFAERDAAPVPRPLRPRLALALAAALLLLALLLSPAGAKVRDWIGDVVTTGKESAKPALTRVPGGGQLLVESPRGAWIVHEDGSRRLLGPYREATWSPHGLYVAATRGHQLSAVDPLGHVRWSLSRPKAVSAPRWSPSGYRVAYLAGDTLRVVAGDGTGDGLLASDVSPVAAAWKPGPGHVLAYGDIAGRVHVVESDSGRRLGPAGPPGKALEQLDWSPDGQRLLAVYPHVALVRSPGGDPGAPLFAPSGGRFASATFVGDSRIAAVVRFGPSRGQPVRSRVIVASRSQPSARPESLFTGPGTFSDLVAPPDGKRLLVAWREPDQWLFIPVTGHRRVSAVANIGRQFDPGASGEPALPRVAGWCCPP